MNAEWLPGVVISHTLHLSLGGSLVSAGAPWGEGESGFPKDTVSFTLGQPCLGSISVSITALLTSANR